MQQMVTVADLAKAFAVSKHTVRRWEKLGQIPAAKRINARSVRWLKSDIDEFLRKGDDAELRERLTVETV